MTLPPGAYTVNVSARGYQSQRVTVRIVDQDVTLPVELDRTASATPTPSASVSTPSRAGEWLIRNVQVDGYVTGLDHAEIMKVLGGYAGRNINRQTLLDGALRVYQATGITLSFTVRSNAGGADLSARVSRRVRRSYESTIPIMTRSQLESSGFGVSVE